MYQPLPKNQGSSFVPEAGFTLLEVLVVLFILLVLLGVTLPAYWGARKRSEVLNCQENVRQLVTAVTSYANDNHHFPPGRLFLNVSQKPGYATDMIKWCNALSPYVPNEDKTKTSMGREESNTIAGELGKKPPGDMDPFYAATFRCPQVPSWDRAGWNMSYGYNHQYLGNADPITLISPGSQPGFFHYPVKRDSILRPDKTICIADSDGTGTGEYQSASDNGGPHFNRSAIGAFGYLIDPPFLPARSNKLDKISDPPPAPGSFDSPFGPPAGGLFIGHDGKIELAPDGLSLHQVYRGVVSSRHDGNAVIGFVDGHVEVLRRESLYLRPAPESEFGNSLYISNVLWNGLGEDNDLDGNGKIDPGQLERLVDPNEAFFPASLPHVSAAVKPNYCPRLAAEAGSVTGLRGPYGSIEISKSNQSPFSLKDISQSGPTLPHLFPVNLPLEFLETQ